MNVRRLAALAVALSLAGAAGTAFACGDGPPPKNLAVNPALKVLLRDAYIRAHPGISPDRVAGPVAGRTYYGAIDRDRYAVATFTVDTHLQYPTILERHFNRPDHWHVVRDTRGGICGRYVPADLMVMWAMAQWRQTDCFVEPTT